MQRTKTTKFQIKFAIGRKNRIDNQTKGINLLFLEKKDFRHEGKNINFVSSISLNVRITERYVPREKLTKQISINLGETGRAKKNLISKS